MGGQRLKGVGGVEGDGRECGGGGGGDGRGKRG